jgi:hypothetical protein
MNDPIVQEVRRYRLEHTHKFRGDLTAICDDLRAIQAASGHMVVRLPPQKLAQSLQSSVRQASR